MKNNLPKISIITPTYNSEETLLRTLKSVVDQKYPEIEYIVIDGGSTDRTVQIIREYESQISFWCSEKDRGISDAFNKGVKQATGDIVGIINSDDWYDPGSLNAIAMCYQKRVSKNLDAAIMHGDMLLHTENDEDVRRVKPRLWGGRGQIEKALWFNMPVNHPACFVPRKIYDRIGLFSEDYKVAMDYHWILRASLAGEHFEYIPNTLSNFQSGGVSSTNTLLAIKEVMAAQKELKVYPFKRQFGYWLKYTVNRLKNYTGIKILPGKNATSQ